MRGSDKDDAGLKRARWSLFPSWRGSTQNTFVAYEEESDSGRALCTTAAIGKCQIVIIDDTEEYQALSIWKYVIALLRAVPEKDLQGIGTIVLRDRSKGQLRGGYFVASTNEAARIDLYLDWALGYPADIVRRTSRGLLNNLYNRVLMRCSGEAWLALTLFHELGHHVTRGTSNLPKNAEEAEKAEEDATAYEHQLYWKIFPLRCYLYHYFDKLLQSLYRAKIKRHWERFKKGKENTQCKKQQ